LLRNIAVFGAKEYYHPTFRDRAQLYLVLRLATAAGRKRSAQTSVGSPRRWTDVKAEWCSVSRPLAAGISKSQQYVDRQSVVADHTGSPLRYNATTVWRLVPLLQLS